MAAGGEGLYLGGIVDPATGERTGAPVHYDPADLTTHGVIVGMTGSGKTGLGVIFLEEALRAGIPTLILDPKGDMANLLLSFPGLSPAEFRPWVDEAAARRDGETPDGGGRRCRRGLVEGARVVRAWARPTSPPCALPPSSPSTPRDPPPGCPSTSSGSLAAPTDFATGSGEPYRDEIEGLVSGLLGLAGIEADPLASREHILVANLVERAWAEGTDLTLEDLIARVHRPPLRKLGVFEIDTFFPEKDRLALAMRLNNLVASPSFAVWRSGPPLDIPSMLWTPGGKPRARHRLPGAPLRRRGASSPSPWPFPAGHLDALAGRVVALRALVYMDEVFGFVPPTAMPPARSPSSPC